MKRILNFIYAVILFTTLSINLFATDWYVKNGGGGSNNGTSWANAWTSFASINWTSVHAGDHVYFDGGVDSVVYTTALDPSGDGTVSGTAANNIYLFAGRNSPSPSGHSGRVIIAAAGYEWSIHLGGDNYIYVKGFELKSAQKGIEFEDNCNGCTVDSCYIYDYTDQAGVMMNGNQSTYSVDSCVVKNNRIISYAIYNGQTDCIYLQGAGHILIHDNYLRQRNQDPAAHTDACQANNSNGAVVYRNFFINDSVNSIQGGGTPMIFGVDGDGTRRTLIANNYLYMGGIWYASGSENCTFNARSYTNQNAQCWFINNTVVTNGPRCRGMFYEWKTYAINNIEAMYNGTTMNNLELEGGLDGDISVDSTRNNLFYRQSGSVSFGGNFVGSGGSPTGEPTNVTWFTTYGGTGQIADPKLVNVIGKISDQGTLKPDLQSTSPAIDNGEDTDNMDNYIDWLNSQGFDGTHPHTGEWMLPKTDIYGTPRGATWDIGAYEKPEGWTPPDTTASFSFTPVTGANLSTEYIATATLSSLDTTTHVSTTTGSQFQINSGGYSTTMKTAVNGDVVYVKNTSSGSYLTATTATIVAGGQSQNFVVTTRAAIDTVPNSFTFTDITGATRSTLYASNGVTLAGFDSAYAYAGGNTFTVNGGSDLTAYTRVHSGDVLRLKLTSSASYSTGVSRTLTVGGVSDTYTVTTLADPGTPSSGQILKGSNGLIIKDSTGKIIKGK